MAQMREEDVVSRKKALDTRDRLLDAAEDVFFEKGYSNTTLNDIAEAANATRGAIYWHFRNKEDLFEAMCLRIRRPMDKMIEEIVEKDVADPIAQLQKTHEVITHQIIENSHYRKILTILMHKCEYTKENERIVAQQREWHTYAGQIIQRILLIAQKKGQLPQDIDIDMAGNLLSIMFKGLLTKWLFMPESFDLPEITRRMNSAIFELFQTSPHLKK